MQQQRSEANKKLQRGTSHRRKPRNHNTSPKAKRDGKIIAWGASKRLG
jgi:hypothetical protein